MNIKRQIIIGFWVAWLEVFAVTWCYIVCTHADTLQHPSALAVMVAIWAIVLGAITLLIPVLYGCYLIHLWDKRNNK